MSDYVSFNITIIYAQVAMRKLHVCEKFTMSSPWVPTLLNLYGDNFQF